MGVSHLGQRGIPGHIRHISEDARSHSPRAIEGFAGSGAGGGNVNLAAPVPFLISERGGEVSHLWVAGGQVYDSWTRGLNQLSGWTENGSVPRVALMTPPGCDGRRQVEGIGPFNGANYLSLGTGPDVLDFVGDFSACVIFSYPDQAVVGGQILITNGNYLQNGYQLWTDATTQSVSFSQVFSGSQYTSIYQATPIRNRINVVCIGRSGLVSFLKINLAALSTAAIAGGTNPATSVPAYLGAAPSIGALPGAMHEVLFSTTPPSDALFTDIMNEVKGRLGITAW